MAATPVLDDQGDTTGVAANRRLRKDNQGMWAVDERGLNTGNSVQIANILSAGGVNCAETLHGIAYNDHDVPSKYCRKHLKEKFKERQTSTICTKRRSESRPKCNSCKINCIFTKR